MTAWRAGVTLIELIVVIVILGILASLTTVALRRAGSAPAPTLAPRVAAARREALRTGRAVSFTVDEAGTPRAVRALPDGRVLADAPLGIDVRTGEIVHASR